MSAGQGAELRQNLVGAAGLFSQGNPGQVFGSPAIPCRGFGTMVTALGGIKSFQGQSVPFANSLQPVSECATEHNGDGVVCVRVCVVVWI